MAVYTGLANEIQDVLMATGEYEANVCQGAAHMAWFLSPEGQDKMQVSLVVDTNRITLQITRV